MSCYTKHLKTSELICLFPENVGQTKGLTVHFHPDYGEQRLVAACAHAELSDCYYEDGFAGKVTDSVRAQITLPVNFTKESGNFTCQLPGVPIADIKPCRWPPEVTESPLDILRSESGFISSTAGNPSHINRVPQDSGSGDGNAIILGAALGTVVFLCLVAIIIFVMYKTFQRINKPGPVKKPETSMLKISSKERIRLKGIDDIKSQQDTETENEPEQQNCETQTQEYSSNEPLLQSNDSIVPSPQACQ